jgi:hypothetical protein
VEAIKRYPNVVAQLIVLIRGLRAQGDLLNRINVIWVVQPDLQKYFPFRLTQITSTTPAVSFPEEGRIAIVTDVGSGMRWTRAARLTKRADADGEVVWS